MIGYATIGTNDLDRARGFYDAVVAALGGRRTFMMGDRLQFYGSRASPGLMAVGLPYDGQPASPSNGGMFGITAPAPEAVDAAYAAALEAGGSCEGGPGLRIEGFYCAYVRDLDGNKLCIFHMAPRPPKA